MHKKHLDFKSYVVNAIKSYKFYHEDTWKEELVLFDKIIPSENILTMLINQFEDEEVIKLINKLRKSGDVSEISSKVEDVLYTYIKEKHGVKQAKKLIETKLKSERGELTVFKVLVIVLVIAMLKMVNRDWRLYALHITF